ncbi:hypothetical protein GC170_16190 [bacterium]|nr:hypothetical protein [bacterium]
MFKKRSQRRPAQGRTESKFRKGASRRLSMPIQWEGSLEDRRLLAAQITLTAANEILYQGSAVNNNLSVDTFGGDYYFTDTAEVINVVIDPGSTLSAFGSGTNVVQIVNIPLTSQIDIRTGLGDDSVEILSAPLNSNFFVDTESGGFDTTAIGSFLTGVSDILGSISVIDSGGVSELTIRDTADTNGRVWSFDQTPTLDGSIIWGTTGFVSYGTGVTTLNANMGSGTDTVTIYNLGLPTDFFNIDTGDGEDFVEVWSTPAGSLLNINTNFGVPDQTVIGSLVAGVNDIFGDIHVIDSGGIGTLQVYDSSNPNGRTWTLGQNIGGEGTIAWGAGNTITYGDGIVTATIEAGSGDDVFTINSTSSFADNVVIFGGDGINTYNVFGNASALSIFGGVDGDFVNIFGNSFQVNVDLDGGPDFVTVFNNQAPVIINTGDDADNVDILNTSAYVSVSTGAGQDIVRVWNTGADLDIATGDDDDTVTIYGTGFGTTTNIDTGNGSGNVVNIGGDGPLGTGVNSLDNVLGSIYVYGTGDAASDTTLNIDDSGSTDADSINFWVDFIAKLGYVWGAQPSGEISYDNAVNTLNFWGGSGGNQINVSDTLIGTLFGTVTTIFTGQGNDSVYVDNNNGPSSPDPLPYSTLIIDLQDGTDRLEVASLTRPGVFRGGLGDDYINASSVVLVPLTIEGGFGDDTIGGGSGNDFIDGNEGDDVISGGDGINTLVGGLGDDDVKGGPGWNAFVWNAGDGRDVFTGGSANDEILANGADASANKFDVNRWGVGYEVVYNDDIFQGFLALAVPSLYLTGGLGSTGQAFVDDMSGIVLDRLAVDFSATTGSEVFLDGTIGADDIRLGVNPDDASALMATGLSYQLRVIGTGDVAQNFVTVLGLSGNDYLKAERGSEVLANITLDGGEGDDTLEADAVLIGGLGNDTFIVPFGINFVDGVAGNDRILILGSFWDDSITVNTLDLGLGANQVSILQGLNSSTNTVLNVDVIEIEAYAGNDTITVTGNGTIPFHINAGADNDTVDASTFTGALTTIYGGSGNDNITGSQLSDYIYGEDGDDNITAGRGADFIFGGADSDTFIWNNGDGSDVVEGDTGLNRQIVNGSASGDDFLVTNLVGRTLFQRTNLVPFFVNMADVQVLSINTGDGNDNTTIGNLAGTTLTRIDIELGASDAFADNVTVTGTDGDDAISVHGSGSLFTDATEVTGLPVMVTLLGGSVVPGGFLDHLTVRSGRGNDSLSVTRNFVQPIGLILDGQGGEDFFDVTVQSTPGVSKVTVIGGEGDDLIHVNEGNVALIGGASDVLEVLGTANNDVIDLTGGVNLITQTVNGVVSFIDIAGYTGVVHIDGLGGNDGIGLTGYSLATTVLGGDGNDFINASGMPVAVSIYGGSGNDVLWGGLANDFISGGTGRDSIRGFAGNDQLFGDEDADVFGWQGGDGNDTVDGGTGYDAFVIEGTAGTDCFHVSPDSTFVNEARIGVDLPGGPANDGSLLAADVEHISLIGGGAADYFEIASMIPTPVTAIDADLGSADIAADIVVVKTSNAGSDVTATPGATGADVDVNGLSALVRLFNTTTSDTLGILGGFGSDNIYVAPETLSLISVLINGGGGNDVLEGATTIIGGSGDDLIKGTDFADVLLGGLGNDTIYGYAGGDLILADATATGIGAGIVCDSGMMGVGAFAINPYVAAGGNDFVWAGSGDDTVNGGFANDSLYGDEGNDLIGYLVMGANPLLPSDFDEPGNDFISGDTGNDTVFAAAGNDSVLGGDGADVLYGNDGDDSIEGGNDNDEIFGGNGNDSIQAGAGQDYVEGNDGNDSIWGGAGIDVLNGNAGNDLIYGEADADAIYGGTGNDTAYGGEGNDYVNGQEGDDSLMGDAGDDIIWGGSGNDTALGGTGNDVIYGFDGNDYLQGNEGEDTVYGGLGDDLIEGNDGNDVLVGTLDPSDPGNAALDGSDTIFGGAGQDAIFGGYGNDFLNGGEGDDQLWGQEGNDTLGVFVFFGAIMYDNGADKFVGGTGDDMIAGALVDTNGAIVPDGNDVAFGQEGNDTIYGGAGGDMLYGGDGDDVILGGTPLTANTMHAPRDPYLPGDGNDTIYGGMGFDSVDGGNDNNLLDAGDDGIRETILGGTGNDMAYTHQATDPVNYDLTALDGGFNHVFKDGGLLEPPVPAIPQPYAYLNWVIPVEYYTGYKTLHNGTVVEHPPLKYRLNPNNGPNGPVKKPIKVKPVVVKKAPVKKTVAPRPTFAGKANTVGKVASAAAALKNKNRG